MNRSLYCLATASLLITAAVITTAPVTAQTADHPTNPQADNRSVPSWGMQIAVIPDILRLHCSVLAGNVGVLVAQVTADGPADRAGLRYGDVVIEVDGSRVHDATDVPAPSPQSRILVLRRGRVQMAGQLGSLQPDSSNGPADEIRRMVEQMIRPSTKPPAIGPGSSWNRPIGSYGSGVTSGAYASSSSSGNESMSVSRANDQISVAMSSPDGGEPIRLKGTMAEVEQQMRDQGLSPATQQKVRRALGQ